MQTTLESMWEGEDVQINTYLLAGVIPTTYAGLVHTQRHAIINGNRYVVSHGYVQIKGRPIEYEETMYSSVIDAKYDTGRILDTDPAPHPERNKP